MARSSERRSLLCHQNEPWGNYGQLFNLQDVSNLCVRRRDDWDDVQNERGLRTRAKCQPEGDDNSGHSARAFQSKKSLAVWSDRFQLGPGVENHEDALQLCRLTWRGRHQGAQEVFAFPDLIPPGKFKRSSKSVHL